MTTAQCDIVILAAGASTRLGRPKQLLLYKKDTFLNNAINTALHSQVQRVIVVLGANVASIKQEAGNDKLIFVINDEWQEGIASSIRAGLNYLLNQTPAPENILYMVCDQPYLSTDLLDKLITLQRQTGHSIVASKYADTIGVPVIFSKKMFPDLLQLKGDAGAKKIIKQESEAVVTIDFPWGNIDIDTEAEYDDL